MDLCKICKEAKKLRSDGFCSTICYNKSKIKGIDGYNKCLLCRSEFPFRSTLKVRSAFSKKFNCFIGSINQKYCSRKCALMDRNINNNPAKTESGREKISKCAKIRGTAHMHTPEAKAKQISSITGDGHWNWQEDKSHPNCVDCGVKITFKKTRCKKCFGRHISGDNAPNWRGGINPESKRLRKTPEYKMWRISVFDRDNHTCTQCGNRSSTNNKVELQADHIKPFCNYPELRLELSNGRTLCVPCHRKTETFGSKALNH